MIRNALISLVILTAATPVLADAKARLEAFIDSTKGLKANFTQTVTDRAGRKTQEASGNLYFSRPGKFRWIYQKPYAQIIVGDGKKLWIHDEDLDQVTVRKLDRALGDSPAALLAGDNDIEKLFSLKDAGIKDGIEWLEATPKSKEGSFEKVRMGFKGDDLQVMELKDNFGQTTLLRFSNLQRNPSMGASLFRFAPPKGADVIGDR
ncbi:MAG: outer membrane lipoprotein chaperone LolA [Pseudomonadota bacterium]|nr:outer membrane lipoprotein chaperone LolA [Pseudomonadota bacterium]